MRIGNEDLLQVNGVRAVQSMSADFTLKPVWLGHIANFAIQLVFTGTPSGTFKLQASADPGLPNAASDSEKYSTVTNWTDISGSDQVIAAAGDHMWTVENAGYTWIRVVYTRTGSTGSVTSARCMVKGV